MGSWNIFGARMSHEHTQTHNIHHGLDLGEATTLPLILLFVPCQGGCTQMSFCPRTPKWRVPIFLKLGFLPLWRPIIFFSNIQLKWNLKQSFNLCREISNDMWHATCTHVIQGDSQLLMVGNQIGTLIFGLSFSHNLCYKYLNPF
jgi:hypothetical protein